MDINTMIIIFILVVFIVYGVAYYLLRKLDKKTKISIQKNLTVSYVQLISQVMENIFAKDIGSGKLKKENF
ncbi:MULTISPECIES: hypothetical protein [unclassified Staphylococcus]|uniref:hypothetical protein n=1 Tax=unclassified Staphylococcus TaxID=91994 RepID=UPI001CB762E0|nr:MULTISPECIES: hypothetical protein [unclassified Staphylococcus]